MLMGKMQFPAFLIMDENFTLLDRVQLYLPPEKFEAVIKFYGDNAYKTLNWQDYKINHY
jgi:thioredoxin-related protein